MKGNKVSRILVGLLLAMIIVASVSVPTMAATSNNITITGAPAFMSISTAQNTWTINGITGSGKMANNTTYYSNPGGDTVAPSATVVDGECYFTTVNTSTIATDVTVNIPNFSGGDAMSNSNTGSNGATSFGAYSYYSGMTYSGKVIAKASGSDVLKDALAATTDIKWGIELKTQSNAWVSGSSMTSTMTISVVAN